MIDEDFIEEVEYLGISPDLRKERVIIEDDEEPYEDHEEFEEEINSIRDKRNKIITFHLYIERAIDRIIDLVLGKEIGSFYGKIEFLKARKLIDDDQFYNLEIINDLRRDYAHILKIEEIEPKYLRLLESLKLSGYVSANPHYDKFQLIVHQILSELKYIHHRERAKKGDGKIENGLTDNDVRRKLEKDKELFWQFCKILKYEKEGYDERYVLQCPYCNQGEIVRIRDGTPGFKESYFVECTNCGLDGDGSNLKIETIKK